MLLGIVSDSHGKSHRLAKALELLASRGAKAVVHCGDIITAGDVDKLAAFDGPTYLVGGNMDQRHLGDIEDAARRSGVYFAADFITVPLGDNNYLAVTHGDIESLLEELACGGQFIYVCHGHTHRRRDDRFGRTRVLNPGSLYHPLPSHHYTVLLLDTETDTIEELVVSR
jgi:hypothetical protein